MTSSQEKKSSQPPRLWESKHPYYCNQGNYFSNDCSAEFGSWAEFIDAEGDADLDMNLVFRWDWELPTDSNCDPLPLNPDPKYRDGKLLLFYVGQRKGLFRYCEVSVCQADEPAVREWLQPRLEHLMKLWAPLKVTP